MVVCHVMRASCDGFISARRNLSRITWKRVGVNCERIASSWSLVLETGNPVLSCTRISDDKFCTHLRSAGCLPQIGLRDPSSVFWNS